MSSVVVLPPAQSRHDATFDGMPTEIREKIWKMSLPGPRVVYLEHKAITSAWSDMQLPDDSASYRADYRAPFGLRSPSIVSMLYVNKQSREIALKYGNYKRAFGTRWMSGMTWINFDQDTLYLDWGFTKATKEECDKAAYGPFDFNEGHAGRVRSLALYDHAGINTSIDNDPKGYNGWLYRILKNFNNLYELAIVSKSHDYSKKELTDLIRFETVTDVDGQLKEYEEIMKDTFAREFIDALEKKDQELLREVKENAPVNREDLIPWDHHDYWVIPEVVYNTMTTIEKGTKLVDMIKEYEWKEEGEVEIYGYMKDGVFVEYSNGEDED
ncbi:hypothetical protein BDZ45DRAFT_802183 [Acephala macrosclerotiorum]|nr:hypothetical protein BDZ45DRAFT_802183 [Acephala macrosclerotiorum]